MRPSTCTAGIGGFFVQHDFPSRRQMLLRKETHERRFGLGRGSLLLGLHQILGNGLLQLGSLPGFVCFTALQDTTNNLTSINMLESMLVHLLEDSHLLGVTVRVIRQGNEGSGPMVDNIRRAQRHRLQVWLAGGEGRREDNGIDVLEGIVSIVLIIVEVEKGRTLRGTEERKDHAQRCS